MIIPLIPPGPPPSLTRIQARGGDFTIPQPRNPGPEPAPTPPGESARLEAAPNPFTALDRTATTTEIALGAGALVVLAVLFLFVRQGVRAHLINRRAALDAANGASWMLFCALMLTAAILVTATVGRLWQATTGLAAGFALCLVLFGAALVLVLRAPERRR